MRPKRGADTVTVNDHSERRRRRRAAADRDPVTDRVTYKRRHAAECGIKPAQAPPRRGDATRHDKLAVRYRASLRIVAINEWLAR